MSYKTRTTCRLCGCAELIEVLNLGRTPLANELANSAEEALVQDTFLLYLVQCAACAHVQLPIVVDPHRLFSRYSYESATAFDAHLTAFARDVVPKPGAFVVEIGSNDGSLLAKYKAQGCEVLGIDPAQNIADIAETRNSVPTLREFFSKNTLSNWNLARRKADRVLALNVFAHADDLREIAESVRDLLSDTGTFVFEVGYLPALLARGIYRTIYHEHLSYHHIAPLQSFFATCGLRMFYSHPIATQGGSMRAFVCKANGGSADTWGMLKREPKNLDFSELGAHIVARRARIHTLLEHLSAKKRVVVCGYGAPAQLTTTCYALDIDAQNIAFICDDSKLKQGKFTPGRGIPIVAPTRLHESDACLIFSANFANEIKQRHSDYKGEWIDV